MLAPYGIPSDIPDLWALVNELMGTHFWWVAVNGQLPLVGANTWGMLGVYFSKIRRETFKREFEERNRICIQSLCTSRTKKKTWSLEALQKTDVPKRICLCLSLCHPLEVNNYATAFNAVIPETKCCILTTEYVRASLSLLIELFLLPQPLLNAKKPNRCLSYPYVAKIQLLHAAG